MEATGAARPPGPLQKEGVHSMGLSQYEQETIINFNEADRTASVYTHSRALLRKLRTLAVERPGECRQERGIEFTVPKTWIHIYPPRKAAPLTEEQKQMRREQLARAKST
jgi:hypothetical protein